MDNKALLEHLNWGVSLEREIYTLEMVCDANEKRRMNTRPEPQKPTYPQQQIPTQKPQPALAPPSPRLEDVISERTGELFKTLGPILCGAAVITLLTWILTGAAWAQLTGFVLAAYLYQIFYKVLAGFIAVVLILLVILIVALRNAYVDAGRRWALESRRARETYSKQRKEYETESVRYMDMRQEQFDKATRNYENSLQEVRDFNSNAAFFNAALDEVQTVIIEEKQGLEEQLAEVYGLGVIHPKYHNIVAYASFYDYLDTKRCYILEGPDGAYDTFEEEVRMDAVILRLDRVVADLERIKENQYTLYRALGQVGESVAALSGDISAGLGNIMQGQRGLAKELSEERADSQRIISQIKGLDAGMGKLAAMNKDVKNYLAQMGRAGK
jgi:uncharacterized membrane protein